MPHYKFKTRNRARAASESDSGSESDYESDGGTNYSPVKPLGRGEYAQARLFKSSSDKAVTVLNPVKTPVDFGEAGVKHRFFQTIYPYMKSHLFSKEDDYRLVVPYIEHLPYDKFKISVDAPALQKLLFQSASQAIKDCHDKGMIVLDLKRDNIYYDPSTDKSYLIDGGLSAPVGTIIDPSAFQKSSQERLEECRRKSFHIPPECWSVSPASVLATPKMDVYCLGVLMSDLLENPSSEIQLLVDRCLDKDPDKRPTLVELIADLELVHHSSSDTPHG